MKNSIIRLSGPMLGLVVGWGVAVNLYQDDIGSIGNTSADAIVWILRLPFLVFGLYFASILGAIIGRVISNRLTKNRHQVKDIAGFTFLLLALSALVVFIAPGPELVYVPAHLLVRLVISAGITYILTEWMLRRRPLN